MRRREVRRFSKEFNGHPFMIVADAEIKEKADKLVIPQGFEQRARGMCIGNQPDVMARAMGDEPLVELPGLEHLGGQGHARVPGGQLYACQFHVAEMG